MNVKVGLRLVPILFFGMPQQRVQGQDGVPSLDATLSFADSLMSQKRFDQAFVEYQRVLHWFPSAKTDKSLLEKMLNAGILSKDYNGTLFLLKNRFPFLNGSTELKCVGDFYAGRCLYSLANYDVALRHFQEASSCKQEDRDRALYYVGLTNLRRGQWKPATEAFLQINENSPLFGNARQATLDAESLSHFKKKSPTLAALLSAGLPGSGYLYCRKPQTALAALVTNGLFIWATVEAARADLPGVAVVTGMFSFGWYFGGVYGSAMSATRYNNGAMENTVEKLELD